MTGQYTPDFSGRRELGTTEMKNNSQSLSLILPRPDRSLERYKIIGVPVVATPWQGQFSRTAFAACHIVVDPLADYDPWHSTQIDWDQTIAFREYIWGLNLGVAEAMDTAQRGMGLPWFKALELIRRTSSAAGSGSLIISGCGTDQLAPEDARTIDDVIRAYEEQMSAVEAAGSRIVLMASRALARIAKSSDDYVRVYRRILGQVRQPVVLHWLGTMFDPALSGYWGHSNPHKAMDVVSEIINENQSKVDGIKISLLDVNYELKLRKRLPEVVKMYTGDDFNYAELIAGDQQWHSHALLGAFNCIAPSASAALAKLSEGDLDGYHKILKPTEKVSRHIFVAPTQYYKAGVVFMAYLNGHQNHFIMAGGLESARSTLHLAELFRLADANGLLRDPELALRRMRLIMVSRGVEQ